MLFIYFILKNYADIIGLGLGNFTTSLDFHIVEKFATSEIKGTVL